MDRVEHKFHPAGDSEFVENPEQIFFYSVLAQP